MDIPSGGAAGADPVGAAKAQGEQVSRSRGLEWFARAGLAARGVIYAIIGILAIEVALGDSSGSTTNQQGALKEIAQQPFGEVLLIVTAVGLAGYAIWRLIRAIIGHGVETGDDSAFDRVGGLVSGITYGALCVTAISIIAGSGSSSGGASSSTGGVLGWPGGTWIVGIVGLIVIGVGLEQAYKGISEKFLEKSKTNAMSEGTRKAFTAIGTFGYVARAVVFVLIGYFLVKAAIDFDPKAAVSLDGALSTLAQASYGPILLGIVAAGLLGFGLYSFADARYRKV
jgi:hypothetical protein